MRPFVVAILLGVMVVGAPILRAHAEGEVLVPDDTSKGTPNLGLTPESPSTTPSTANPPGMPLYTPTPQSTFAPATSSFPPAATGISPQPSSITAQSIQAILNKMPHTTLPASSSTQIVNLPDSAASGTWNNIDVAVEPKWKNRSVLSVSDHLGIKDSDVPSMCRISVSGMIRTDKNSAIFDTGASDRSTSRYSGKLTGVISTVKALCSTSAPLPANKGMIFQIGDKYVVPLGTAQCQPTDPNKTSRAISVTFTDDGAPQCSVQ